MCEMDRREIIWHLLFSSMLITFAIRDFTGISVFPQQYAIEFTRFILVAIVVTLSLSLRSIMLMLLEKKVVLNMFLFSVYWFSMCQWVVLI